MDKITALGLHSQLSFRGMNDNIWKEVAPDIVGPDSSKLRFMIPLITSCYRSRASLAVGDFCALMDHYQHQTRPTTKAQLRRATDLGYAYLQQDAGDKRIKRVHATMKAVRAARRADELTLLSCLKLVRTCGDALGRISDEVKILFETDIAFDAAATINNQRGRRKA